LKRKLHRPIDQKKNEIEIPTREAEKTTGSFNLENKINKIKIPVPLVELAKNPTYRKQIAKMINFRMLKVM
jgi:hypothetical protein